MIKFQMILIVTALYLHVLRVEIVMFMKLDKSWSEMKRVERKKKILILIHKTKSKVSPQFLLVKLFKMFRSVRIKTFLNNKAINVSQDREFICKVPWFNVEVYSSIGHRKYCLSIWKNRSEGTNSIRNKQ